MKPFLEILLILLSLVFLTNLYRPRVRNYYIAFLLLIVITVVVQTLFYETVSKWIPFKIYFLLTNDFYYGPLLYLYLCEIINVKVSKGKIAIHLVLPFLVTFTHLLLNTYDIVASPKLRLIFSTISSLWVVTYFIMGVLLLKRTQQKAKTRFLMFYYIINCYLIFQALMFILSLLFFVESSILRGVKTTLMDMATFYYNSLQPITFFIFCFAFFLYAVTESLWLKKYIQEHTFERQRTLSKNDEEIIENDLKSNQRELDTTLTLEKYSKILQLSTVAINNYCKVKGFDNFVHFMNARRINNFKELLNNKELNQYSIDGLALEAGFKSRSTFYRVFKKLEGMSPLEYKEKMRVGDSLL